SGSAPRQKEKARACGRSLADHAEPGEIANNYRPDRAAEAGAVGVLPVEDRAPDPKPCNQHDQATDDPEQDGANRVQPAALRLDPDVDFLKVESKQDEHQPDQEEDQEQEEEQARGAASGSESHADIDIASAGEAPEPGDELSDPAKGVHRRNRKEGE